MSEALAALAAVLVVPLLVAEHRRHPGRGPLKAAASSAFVAAAVAAGAFDSGYGRWVLAGLALSWVGDVALVSSRRRWFLTGLAAFLAAHLAYVAAFATAGIAAPWVGGAAALLVIPAAAVWRWLRPSLPSGMAAPVAAYVVVISAMVAAAIGGAAGSTPPASAPAAAAFYVSDLFVARDRFVAPGIVNRLWGLPLYYGAQITLALSVGMV